MVKRHIDNFKVTFLEYNTFSCITQVEANFVLLEVRFLCDGNLYVTGPSLSISRTACKLRLCPELMGGKHASLCCLTASTCDDGAVGDDREVLKKDIYTSTQWCVT